jgi:hypothetical protein
MPWVKTLVKIKPCFFLSTMINQCISPMFNPYLNGLVITCHPTKKNETHLLPPVVTRLIPQGGAASIAAQLLSELH